MPASAICDGEGWTHAEPPQDGVVVKLKGKEAQARGAYLANAQLLKAGLVPVGMPRLDVEKFYMALHKDSLGDLVESLGGPRRRNKKTMVAWLLG